MTDAIPATGALLEEILAVRQRSLPSGLTPHSYGQFHSAQTKTPWGSRSQSPFALRRDGAMLASAERYEMQGVLDGRQVQGYGIGSVCCSASPRGTDSARTLITSLAGDAAVRGVAFALLFPSPAIDSLVIEDFRPITTTELTLQVVESTRHGAPMTTVRVGEERDLPAIVTMGSTRAQPFRFHLDRDADFVRYVIARKRLLGGLGPANARQLHFFIAEEGVTAAAYVVISVTADTWVIEECGDRDPSGARVGALLQALIAREPSNQRPTIRAWLPASFMPPQMTVVSAVTRRDVLRVRVGDAATPPLGAADVLYWRNDVL